MTHESRNHLLYIKDGAIAKMTLNRPETLNSFSMSMIRAWAAGLQDAQDDPDIRVVVLSGAGKAFCAGGDVNCMLEGTGFFPDEVNGECWGEKAITRKTALMKYIHKIALTLDSMDKPVLCAINGFAIGAGLDMALMCDIRIMADTAQLSSGYIRAGLVPGDGGCYYLPRLVGVAKALELFWTADFISANEALRIGMVNKVVPAADLERVTMEMARKIADGPPVSIRMIKRAVYSSMRTQDLRTALDMISSHMALLSEMNDFKEGLLAIVEKRKPVFKGE